jgi:hypothetical protein
MDGSANQAEDVEQQPLVIPLPSIGDEPVFRAPAMRQRGAAIAGPFPVGTLIKRCGEAADFHFIGGVAIEVCCNRQGARKQECGIDGGHLALPDSTARFDVQKMVEKAFVPGRIRLWSLRAFHQVSQSPAGELRREFADDNAALHDDGE